MHRHINCNLHTYTCTNGSCSYCLSELPEDNQELRCISRPKPEGKQVYHFFYNLYLLRRAPFQSTFAPQRAVCLHKEKTLFLKGFVIRGSKHELTKIVSLQKNGSNTRRCIHTQLHVIRILRDTCTFRHQCKSMDDC